MPFIREHVAKSTENCNLFSTKNVTLLNIPLINISSTDIRQRIKKGETIKGLVPECIENDVKMFYSKNIKNYKKMLTSYTNKRIV